MKKIIILTVSLFFIGCSGVENSGEIQTVVSEDNSVTKPIKIDLENITISLDSNVSN